MFEQEKEIFLLKLKKFVESLSKEITQNNEWTIKGFIDVFQNIYTISQDTKVISKILELQLFPYLNHFAESVGYKIELARFQNWYPDLTFINQSNPSIKFAVDLKTTYFSTNDHQFCNGFTLGSHGEYFIDRKSSKNIQYPYSEYAGHFCIGIIYDRAITEKVEEMKIYSLNDLKKNFISYSSFCIFCRRKMENCK